MDLIRIANLVLLDGLMETNLLPVHQSNKRPSDNDPYAERYSSFSSHRCLRLLGPDVYIP